MSHTSRPGPTWYAALTDARLIAGTPPEATAVCFDSRQVVPGAVFVAIPGAAFDGHDFIGDAVQRGAAAVIMREDRAGSVSEHVFPTPAFVAVPDTRVALAEASAGFHGHPARSLVTVGVTGTDGKTTTTHLIANLLNETARPAGYLSSVEFGLPARRELNASHMTTLEAPSVQAHLARVRDAGGRYAVIEASSHGLDMHRVDGCEFDVGVFTNLAPDHLDYHGTMEAYRDAKARLFRMLDDSADKGVPKAAVLNADDPASDYMRSQTRARAITYGLRNPADVAASDIHFDRRLLRQTFRVRARGQVAEASYGAPGEYNVMNCLAALAVAVHLGADFRDAVDALLRCGRVPGRLEPVTVDRKQPFEVYVDIASTEQAMRNVLAILRADFDGRIIVVFGAAGERDRERRSGIARAVAERADFAIITNEDPRSEDPDEILGEIAAAFTRLGWAEGERFERVPDRRTAIASAVRRARPGDAVLLAGKGTEQSIVIGTTHHPWDERRIAREVLEDALVRRT